MKTALVHYWLVSRRGGEKVLDALCELFPDAELYTHVATPEIAAPYLAAGHRVHTSLIQRLPWAPRLYKSYLPFMPYALSRLDLRGYDLIVSSESGPAKGIRKPAGARHICYCHTPMRYLWDLHDEYLRRLDPLRRTVFRLLLNRLRQWDLRSAESVDVFVANSAFVAGRIRQVYGRDAVVIHPPVDVEFYGAGPRQPEDFYLMAGQLTGYKRPELALEAFRGQPRRLVVAGVGEELGRLRRMAPPNVEFRGRVDDGELRALYARCRALIFPGVEDFGIVPVEAQAAGAPVLAFGQGGALETVRDGQTGLFFTRQRPEDLWDTVRRFEAAPPGSFAAAACRAHAQGFSKARFQAEFRALLAAPGSPRT